MTGTLEADATEDAGHDGGSALWRQRVFKALFRRRNPHPAASAEFEKTYRWLGAEKARKARSINASLTLGGHLPDRKRVVLDEASQKRLEPDQDKAAVDGDVLTITMPFLNGIVWSAIVLLAASVLLVGPTKLIGFVPPAQQIPLLAGGFVVASMMTIYAIVCIARNLQRVE